MRPTAFALALMSAVPIHGQAAETPDAAQIAALAERIRDLEDSAQNLTRQANEALALARAAQAELAQLKSDAAQTRSVPEPAPAAASASANAFNPAITVILDGVYENHSRDPGDYLRAGFPLVGEGGPGEQGLQLGESEISLAANIDDAFYGQLTLALESEDGETEVGLEEAYVETSNLPDGFKLRAGRFFSNIGYLNSRHAHTDLFSARPLAYQAFLGSQYGDDGVQLRWVAPTDTFLEVGGELFRGGSYPAQGAAHDGVGAHTLFAHAGGDVGISNSWLAGVSWLRAEPRGGDDGFSGSNDLFLFDFTWKWAPRGAYKDAGIVLRSEAFIDDRDGVVLDAEDPDALAEAWDGRRRGAYVEGLYRFNRRWDLAYRYDRLWAAADGPYASRFDPRRQSAALTWHNSEFSMLRLQLARDEPQPNTIDHVLSLQYQMNLGAHGAHKF
jgi:hypothetical protein